MTMGVPSGGWGCLKTRESMCAIGMACCAFSKVPPHSASAAEETMLRSLRHSTKIAPFGIGVPVA